MAFSDTVFDQMMKDLFSNYHVTDADDRQRLLRVYAQTLMTYQWVDDQLLLRAAIRVAKAPYNRMPSINQFVDHLTEARVARDREAKTAPAALEAPAKQYVSIKEYGYAKWDRSIATGKAHTKKRRRLIEEYRQQLPPEARLIGKFEQAYAGGKAIPTEEEIDEEIRLMARRRELKSSLEEALAARVPFQPLPGSA